MSLTLIAVVAGVLAFTNLVAWAAFRIDKARAQRGLRRIPERRLLWLAAFGGAGALIAMYAHQRRHKVDKRRFARAVWLLALLQIVVLVAAVVLAVG